MGSPGHAAHAISCDLPKSMGLGTSRRLFEELSRDVYDDWYRAYQRGDGEEWILTKFREHFLEPGGTADAIEDAKMPYREVNLNAELNSRIILME